MSLKLVDARSGKVLEVGKTVEFPPTVLRGKAYRDAIRLDSFTGGLFSGRAKVTIWTLGEERVIETAVPVRYFPRLIWGPKFPVGGLRVAILPT